MWYGYLNEKTISIHPSGFHCINQVDVDNQVGGNNYEWRNISKSCDTFESN